MTAPPGRPTQPSAPHDNPPQKNELDAPELLARIKALEARLGALEVEVRSPRPR